MEIYAMREFDGHELVVFGHNANLGLHAIVAVHSTALGPAATPGVTVTTTDALPVAPCASATVN